MACLLIGELTRHRGYDNRERFVSLDCVRLVAELGISYSVAKIIEDA